MQWAPVEMSSNRRTFREKEREELFYLFFYYLDEHIQQQSENTSEVARILAC